MSAEQPDWERLSGSLEWQHRRALMDGRTLLTIGRSLLRIVLVQLAAVAVLIGGLTLMLTPSGNTRAGVPDAAVAAVIAVSVLVFFVPLINYFNLARLVWVLARHPWRPVDARLEFLAPRPSDNPVPLFHLSEGQESWVLTPATPISGWKGFQSKTLLVTGRPGKGGAMTDLDRKRIVWAGRSLNTNRLLRRQASLTKQDPAQS